MLASIDKIQKLALLREGSNWHHLRFLSQIHHQPLRARLANEVFLQLTPLGQVKEPYIAVSYTWDRNDLDFIPASTPQYRIIMPDKRTVSPSKGLNYVAHRSLQFASSRGISCFWIDQLCIQQDDPEDVERHLQCMQKVFAESVYTFAPLSFCFATASALDSFEFFLQCRFQSLNGEKAILESAEKALKLFKLIVEDRWFQRAWTYQERRCGKSVHVAFHVDPSIKRTGLSKREDPTELIVSLEQIRNAFANLWVAIRYTSHTSTDAPGLLILSQLENVLHFKFDFQPGSDSLSELKEHQLGKQVFYAMESCGITVVSDRLAVFANILQFIYRLSSTLLNHAGFSYSTCVLVLVLSNGWPQLRTSHESSQRMYFAVRFDSTITEIVGTLADPSSRNIMLFEPADSRKAIYIVDEEGRTHVDDSYILVPMLAIEELEGLAFSSQEDPETGMNDLTRRLTRHSSHMGTADTESKLRWIQERALLSQMASKDVVQEENTADEVGFG